MQLHSHGPCYMARDPAEKGAREIAECALCAQSHDTVACPRFLTFELAEIHSMCALRRAHTLGQRRCQMPTRDGILSVSVCPDLSQARLLSKASDSCM